MGSARSSCEAPIHFWPHFWPSFEFSPHAPASPRAAAVEDEGFSLPGELVSAQHAVILLPDPRHMACDYYLSAHIQIVTSPQCRHVVHAGSRNEVIADRSVAY